MAGKPKITKKEIVAGLRALGLGPGSNVIAHTALSSLGEVEGGADTVIDALIEAISPGGTLVMPTFGAASPFDAAASPTNLGAIPEAFRKRPGVRRSRHPLSNVAAFGPRAEHYTQGHEDADCPYLEGTPYWKLAADGGYILLLGCDHDRNTTLHAVEAAADAPYLAPKTASWIDAKGSVREKEYQRFPGPHRNFIGVDRLLREAGVQRVGRIGTAVVRLIKSKAMIDLLVPRVRADPNLFLSASPDYWDGVWQRGRVRRYRLRNEPFRLLIQSSSAGATLEDALWEAAGLGAAGLELDIVDGRDLADLSPADLDYLRRRLEAKDLPADVVRGRRAGGKAFDKYLQAAQILRASAVVVPLTGTAAVLRQKADSAANKGLALYLENVATSAQEAGELLAELGGGAKLAFNPAAFAEAGELPFLTSFRHRAIKKHVGYLVATDIGRDGRPRPPGQGKAEVAEIVSILRAGGFSGPIVLARPPGAEFSTHLAADALWEVFDRAGVE